MAPASANRPPKATGVTRSMMAEAAIAWSPNRAMMPVKNAFATGAAMLVRMAGTAMAKKGRASCNNALQVRAGQQVVDARDIAEAHIEIDHARDIDRHRRAVGLQAEAEDQDRIENHRHGGDRQGGIHAALGVARRAQHGRESHAEGHQRRSSAARSRESSRRPGRSRSCAPRCVRISGSRGRTITLTSGATSGHEDAARGREPPRIVGPARARARARPARRSGSSGRH